MKINFTEFEKSLFAGNLAGIFTRIYTEQSGHKLMTHALFIQTVTAKQLQGY